MKTDELADRITDADETELAPLMVAAIRTLGCLGRPAAEKLLVAIQEAHREAPNLIDEGMLWLEAVEGVLSGRTDSL